MRRLGKAKIEEEHWYYPVHKGYTVKSKRKNPPEHEQYIVPWEMTHEKKKTVL